MWSGCWGAQGCHVQLTPWSLLWSSDAGGSRLLNLPALADEPTAAKTKARHVVVTLAHLLASWECGASRDTWRRPSGWDQRIMQALGTWGYTLSEVEQRVIDAG